MITARIICIGDELLIGQTINTNASFIASELNKCGISVLDILTISDNKTAILHALQRASENTSFVFITGGLGPTSDDITKNTLCEFFDSHLKLHEGSLENIKQLFAKRGWGVSERNRLQAQVPHNCKPILNVYGTAPGMWFTKNETHFFSMPGVPFEMKQMMIAEVIPILNQIFSLIPIINKLVLTIGIGESTLADLIADWELNLPKEIKLAYLPEPGIVKLKLNGTNESLIYREIEKLKLLIPDYIFGYDSDTIQKVIGNLLINNNKTLATAESCTGGYISHLITSVAGSSAYYKGSLIAYDNKIKEQQLKVQAEKIVAYGAVSQEVVEIMAENCRKIFETDFSIAVSGIAGPGGGTTEKPVGTTWIAIGTPSGTKTQMFQLGDDRERNIRRAALFALNMLRKEILTQ